MRSLLGCLFIIVFISCNVPRKNNDVATDTSSSVQSTTQLKNLDEVKLALLDARCEKAEIMLGKPDLRGKIMLGYFYYMIYFSKVNDNGIIKHLVLLVDGSKGINDRSPIYKIVAVNDGEVVDRAGNYVQWLKVSKTGLTSNSMDFTYGTGDLSWADVDFGRGEKTHDKSNDIITSVKDLPIPAQAIKPNAEKKYTVTSVSAREIYLWYANNYHATLQSNEPSDHKYLYMPFDGNDNCILLKMTGDVNGFIYLEFSFECGD